MFSGASGLFVSGNQDDVMMQECDAIGGNLVIKGTNETTTTICAGDGISDAFDVTLTGIAGDNQVWIITDADGNILGLPTAPPFDLEGAGIGTCKLYSLSYSGDIDLPNVGGRITELTGCFELSNAITVIREDPAICNPEETGCHAPRGLRVSDSFNNRYVVYWNKVDDARSYVIRISYTDKPSVKIDIPVRGRKVYITSRSNRTLTIQVKSICAGGEESAFSDLVEINNDKRNGLVAKSRSGYDDDLNTAILLTEFVELFPNPAQQMINVAFETGNENAVLNVFNMTGQRMMQQRLRAGDLLHRVDITSLIDGPYMIQISSMDGQFRTQEKFLKLSN
jgi:hypothetical protein